MNEKTIIDVRGTMKTAVSDTATNISGMFLILLILGCLFLPWFTAFFEHNLQEKYNTSRHPENYIMVRQKMAFINLTLWLISTMIWLVVIICAIIGYAFI